MGREVNRHTTDSIVKANLFELIKCDHFKGSLRPQSDEKVTLNARNRT